MKDSQRKAMFANKPKNIKLVISDKNWIFKEKYDTNPMFPEKIDFKNTEKIMFSKYTDVANYLDTRPELKNKVMLIRTLSQTSLPNKVVFDGVNTFIENRGHI